MTKKQQEMRFSLNISADDYLYYYKGQAKGVLAKGQDGRTIHFPASALQKYLTHDGISGNFIIRYDANHKLIELEKLDD